MEISTELKKPRLSSQIFSQVKISDGFLMNAYLGFPVSFSFFIHCCFCNWIVSQKEEKSVQGFKNFSFLFWLLSHLFYSDCLHYLMFL